MHNFIICDQLPDTELIFGIDIQKKRIFIYLNQTANENIFGTMVVFHYDAHVHEHLLDKRVMHMWMCIP